MNSWTQNLPNGCSSDETEIEEDRRQEIEDERADKEHDREIDRME